MLLTDTYSNQILGVISCYDRIIIQGTLPEICYAQGMTGYLKSSSIRIFDYPRFADPLRHELRENAERTAKENGIEIQFLNKSSIRKESIIQQILEQRGSHSGIVHIFSAMESCDTYKPWHNKQTGSTYLRPDKGKCLHYYFYLIDPCLGLCHVRVPTWCPFRLQIYFNGHGRLASCLRNENIQFTLLDNAFINIGSFDLAQSLSNNLSAELIHRKADQFAEQFCPVIRHFSHLYHWSIMQAEYATDIIFKQQQDLHRLYEHIARTAVHTVKPDNIATFLGRTLHANYKDETGNRFNTRIEGTRIKHSMGPASIKMYDKFGLILRIETTANNVSFFKHYRKVEHRNGTESMKFAPVKKSIYSLTALQEIMQDSNRRYLQFISNIADISAGINKLNQLSNTVYENKRPYKGFNFFHPDDQKLFEAIASGEFNISGFRNKNLKEKLSDKSTGQISRILKRLRNHNLIKKISKGYKYYLTRLGSRIVTMGLKLKELVIIPELAR